MPDFSKRSADIEIMDDLSCSGEVVAQTLRELEKINLLLGGNHVTIAGLRNLTDSQQNKLFKVADLGCGSGDILRLIHKWGIKNRIRLELIGVDANPFIIAYAREHTPSTIPVRYEAMDIFSEAFADEKFDIVIGTLFFHHFSNDKLVSFFRQLKTNISTGVIINDIHRHTLAYYSIKLLTKFLSRSSMVKFDAPLSVLRAFKKKELIEIMKQAGITNYTIKWMWAFRWQLVFRPDKLA
jgi:2-polyprenyl-3-methyl-5-hydroxy-6-metoxy-1,4-benzoquinol methylase